MLPIRQFARLPLLALTAAIAATALTGCEDSLSPRNLSGVYVLESVGGSPLPAHYGTYIDAFDNSPVTNTIYADTLTLFENGTGFFGGELLLRSTLRNGEYELDFVHFGRQGFTYVARDGVIMMTTDAPDFPLFQSAGNSRSLVSVPRGQAIAPPDQPLYLSYIVLRYRATLTDAGLAVDGVNDSDFGFSPRRVFKRIG